MVTLAEVVTENGSNSTGGDDKDVIPEHQLMCSHENPASSQ